VVDNALASHASPVIVVTGHERERIEEALAGRPVLFAHAEGYSDGLSASLKAGLAAVPPDAEGVLVCLVIPPLRVNLPFLTQARPLDRAHFVVAATLASKLNPPAYPAFDLSPREAAPPPSVTSSLNWQSVALGIVGAGIAISLLRLLVGLYLLRRLVERSTPVRDATLRDALWQAASTTGIPAPLPPVLESESIHVPMVTSWPDQALLLPSSWREWTPGVLASVLAHELTHVARRDTTWRLLVALARCVFWFHPIAWWIERRMDDLAELACDSSALRAGSDRQAYAETVLHFARAARPLRLSLQSIQPGSLGPGMARRGVIQTRIDRILHSTELTIGRPSASVWVSACAVILPCLLGAAALRGALSPDLAAVEKAEQSATYRVYPADALTPDQAQQLEQRIAHNPHDLDTRAKLIAFYYLNGLGDRWREHVFWSIENHPEWTGFHTRQASVQGGVPFIRDGDIRRANELWSRVATTRSTDADALTNAAIWKMRSIYGEDPPHSEIKPEEPFAAELLLQQALLAESRNASATRTLVSLYASAITGYSVFSMGDVHGLQNPPIEFSEHVRAELERPQTAEVLGNVAAAILHTGPQLGIRRQSPVGRSWRDYEIRLGLAESYLLRAAVLAPSDARWPAALQELWNLPGAGCGLAPASPGDSVQKQPICVTVAQDTQAAKLVGKAAPVYLAFLPLEPKIPLQVRLQITIGQDGRVTSAFPISGEQFLYPEAKRVAGQYVYGQTLRNGRPVNVSTTVDIAFAPAG